MQILHYTNSALGQGIFCSLTQETSSTFWTMIIAHEYMNTACEYMSIAYIASANTVCKPPVGRHVRLRSVVLHFIYV